jgi:hypothetical protein
MQDVHVGQWTRETQVSVETLESLHELNYRFLDLGSAQAGDWHAAHDPGISGRMARLSPAQRRAVADCPYALFDLRFDNEDYWRARLQTPPQWHVRDDLAGHEAAAGFVRIALFFAWHVASTARLAARFMLGMNEMTVSAFRGVTIDCIPALAEAECGNLTARWSGCPAYWDALTSAASRPNPVLLRRIQLSGLQLAAASQLR